jgi:hypothetical protein
MLTKAKSTFYERINGGFVVSIDGCLHGLYLLAEAYGFDSLHCCCPYGMSCCLSKIPLPLVTDNYVLNKHNVN